MDRDITANSLLVATSDWILRRSMDLGSITFTLLDACNSSITLEINGNLLQIIIPPSFNIVKGGRSSAVSQFSGEVFLVTTVGPTESNDSLANTVVVLNEKLERLGIHQPDALSQVLDHILLAFQRHECKIQAKRILKRIVEDEPSGEPVDVDMNMDGCDQLSSECDNNDGESDVSDDDDSSDLNGYCDGFSRNRPATCESSLYVKAETAKLQCELALEAEKYDHLGASEHDDVITCSKFLQWCVVKPIPDFSCVELLMYPGGIVKRDVGMSALGFSLDAPLKISLQFRPESWQHRNYKSSGYKLLMEVSVTQGNNIHDGKEIQNLRSLNRRKHNAMHFYGTDILLPDLIRSFFDFQPEKNVTAAIGHHVLGDDLATELEMFTAMENPFIGLVGFLSARFLALPNWCVICWKSIPYSICRIRTCNSEFCLYRFEELGLGSCVLAELQNSSEILDFELSLANAAANSDRNVFEPFPTFLLQREEQRHRSGWFSEVDTAQNSSYNNYTSSTTTTKRSRVNENKGNKNLAVLKAVLQSYPPVTTMRHCPDEVALKETVKAQWEVSQKQTGESQRKELLLDDSTVKSRPWLSYDVLRFVLSTGRHTLHPLQGDYKLGFPFSTSYEFAILHNNPEKEACFERRKIQKGGSFFAFHGSASENWFSILRNGLRCLSDTPLMSCGATYGSGIYLSSQISTSIAYCHAKPGWNRGILEDGFRVLAICEVINGSIRDYASRSVMVVPPECENDIAIRYLIVLNPILNHSSVSVDGKILSCSRNIDLMHHYQDLRLAYALSQEELQQTWRAACKEHLAGLDKEMKAMEEPEKNCSSSSSSSTTSIRAHAYPSIGQQPSPAKSETMKNSNKDTVASPAALQAISREYKNIMKQIQVSRSMKSNDLHNNHDDDDMKILSGISVKLTDESNICRWQVELNQGLFKRFPLYKDLQYCARLWNLPEATVKLEFLFPPDFPFAPPFVRVVSPKFVFHTGHITVGGSICMELLTESGWSPACSFESLIVQIVNAIVEGEGRLDQEACKRRSEYSEYEARQAFDRVARHHGWRK